MRLLHLFEEVTKLEEARSDRYLQMFTGIFNVLDQVDQLAVAHGQELAKKMGDVEYKQTIPETKGAEIKQNIQEQVNWAMNVLGRADRITWWLRWYKIWVLKELTAWGDLSELGPEFTQKLQKGLQKDVAKIQAIHAKWPAQLNAAAEILRARIAKLQARTRTAAGADTSEIEMLEERLNTIQSNLESPSQNIDIASMAGRVVGPQSLLGPGGVGQMQPNLQHFMQMATMDQGIQNLKFENQTPAGLEAELSQLEDEWRSRMGRFIGQEDVPEGAEVLIEFPDGSHWIDLNQRSCDAEAKAMGHCGNVNWGGSHDNVLSYRQPETHPESGEKGWVPRLTFILDKSSGYLGEMKGYKNQKPSPEYHDKIVELLKLPLIDGIKGGGHAPENNFSMADLDQDVAEALMQEKPALATLSYAYEMNNRELDDNIFEKVNQLLDEHGIANMESYDKNNDLIIEENVGDAEATYNQYGPHGYDDDFYGNESEVFPKIIERFDDDTITALKHYVIEVYNALPEDKIPFNVSSQDSLSVEEVMDWDSDELFNFLNEENDEVYDEALSESFKESYAAAYQSEVEYSLESVNEYGDEVSGDLRKLDDGNYQVFIDVDEFMEHVVPQIESGEKDNRSWYEIFDWYMRDAGESLSEDMNHGENEWLLDNTVNKFEEHEVVKRAISVGQTGVPEPDNEFQQEFDFGSVQIPPKPERPDWDDYKDEENTEAYSDATDKFQKDLKQWTELVRKHGGEEHAPA